MTTTERLSTTELLTSERRLIATMERLGFGRFERLKIQNGEPVMTPWPMTVHDVRLSGDSTAKVRTGAKEVILKRQVVELLEYIRNLGSGEILTLEFRHGLPFKIEIEVRADPQHAEGSR